MHIETVNINVSSSQSSVARAFLEALLRTPDLDSGQDTSQPSTETTTTPTIGTRWEEKGGIYAGIARGMDGEPDGHIVLLDATPESELGWDDAVQWATALGNDARLPTRFESALLYANLRDQFKTDGWYWTGTQSSANLAWFQDFSGGFQYYYGKSVEARARAVRRFAI